MKSFSLARAFVVGSLVCFALPLACGDSEDNPNPMSDGGEDGGGGEPAGGGSGPVAMGGEAAGGAPVMLPPGISTMPMTIECSTSCESGRVGLGMTNYYLDPCCTDGEDACGLNTTFLATAGAVFAETCQPKNQPGELDEACPTPDAAMIPAMGATLSLDAFPGCCRPNGTCGVVVDTVSAGGGLLPLGDLELGCVDAEPFFPGEAPVPCGEGAGGAGGAGGAPSVVGGDGAGGASGGAGGAN